MPSVGSWARAALRARVVELPLLALWLLLAGGLWAITGHVRDWFVMTDELLYERLAISVVDHGSLLPRIHGDLIPNVNQLYPVLLAPLFRDGLVTDSLGDAHVLNAFVMSSVCIPAYLLAHRVAGRRWAAYLVALLSVCVPWIVFASFLLTEVVAYPAFVWAVYGLHCAIAAPSRRNDVLALVLIGVAILARTQFLVLLAVAPLAIVAHQLALARGTRLTTRPGVAARASVKAHRLLAGVYAALAVIAVALLAAGRISSLLGTYSEALERSLLPADLHRSFAEHIAPLALGLGILPFVIGLAWLLANLGAAQSREQSAFASLGTITIAAVLLQVTVFDLNFVGFVADRYSFYVVPVMLVAFACALSGPEWPRWSLIAPAGLVATGFALSGLPRFELLNVNTPAATLHDSLLDWGESLNGARAVLVVATGVLTVLFVQASSLLTRPRLAALLAILTVATLAAETAYAFTRLFRVDGSAGRPLTSAKGEEFYWIDEAVPTDEGATMVPYPYIGGNYGASLAHWWDIEFWNRSITRAAYRPGEYEWTPPTFPKLYLSFDSRTGAASESPTRYVVQSAKETRFRVAGDVVSLRSDVLLVDAGPRWSAQWVSSGLYADGWTYPGAVARIRVFSVPGQETALVGSLTLITRAPPDVRRRSVRVESNLAAWEATATNTGSLSRSVKLCLPATGFTDVTIRTPERSRLPYGDMRDTESFGQPREGGIFIAVIALADELGPACKP